MTALAGYLRRAIPRPRDPLYSRLFLAVLLAPFVAVLLLGLGVPLFQTAENTLWAHPDGFGAPYAAVIENRVFWIVIRQTLRISAIVALTCAVLAYPTAELIARSSPRWRLALLMLVLVPLWSSTIARTYAWVGIFIRNGVIDRIWIALGGGEPLQLLFSEFAVYVGMVHVLFPFVLLPVYAAVSSYPSELTDASLSLGAGRLRTLVLVKLPVLAPQILAPTVAVFVLAIGFFITPAMLGGPRSQLISNLIAQQILQRFDLARGQAMSLMLLFLTVLVLAVAGLVAHRVRKILR